MAIAQADDLALVLSGGQNNINVNLSLGGNPSAVRVVNNVINNLFDDVTAAQARDGYEDYRCLYLFNDAEGDDSTVYNLGIWIEDEHENGSDIYIGISDQNELQRITLTPLGPLSGGSFDISFEGFSFTTSYDPDLGVWAEDIQNQLLSLVNEDSEPVLNDVVVTAQQAPSSVVIFDIAFVGLDGKKNHELLETSANSLTPSTDITVATLQEGMPVNTIAPTLDISTSPPNGVSFFQSSSESPLQVPKLASGEGFPIWFRRTTVAGSTAVPSDYVSIAIESTILP